jgi:hypothetical protein
VVGVNKSEVTQRVIDGLRLNQVETQQGFNAPLSINPVYVSNEVPTQRAATFSLTLNGTLNILTFTSGKRTRIKTFNCVLTSTATVGNRIIVIAYRNTGTTVFYRMRVNTNAQAAGATKSYCAGIGSDAVTTADYEIKGLPDLWLDPGASIQIYDDASIDAADTISLRMIWEESSLNSIYSN